MFRSTLGFSLTFLAASACPATAHAADFMVNLPAQSLARSLSQLAGQARVDLLFSSKLVRARRAPAVRGRLTIDEALQRLLTGSRLSYRRSGYGAIVIVPAPAADAGERDDEGSIPEILVIGQRTQNADIRRTEGDILPYQVASRREVENAHAETAEGYLRSRLPANGQMATPSQLSLDNLGSARSELNLRGLGARQTLILVDGRRLPSLPSIDNGFNQPDINALPLAALSRIETLTSAAGGIYGPGAIAGVVNFVIDRDYRGGTLSVTSGIAGSGDALFKRVDGSFGFTPDGGETDIMVVFGHAVTQSLTFGDRDYTVRARRLKLQNDSETFVRQLPISSSVNVFSSLPLRLDAEAASRLAGSITHFPVGPAADYATMIANDDTIDLSLSPDANGTERSLLPASSRTSLLLNARRRISNVEVFFDGLWLRNRARSVLPSTLQHTVVPASANPFEHSVEVTFPQPGFKNVGANRSSVYRITTGAILDLPKDWRANVEYLFGGSNEVVHLEGDRLSTEAFDGAFGKMDPLGRPVPNPFQDYASFLSALDQYREPNTYRHEVSNKLSQFSMRFAGPLIYLPRGPTTLSVLGEHRSERVPASVVTLGPRDGIEEQPTPDVSQKALSVYAEARAPICGPRKMYGPLKNLELQLAMRHDRIETRVPSQIEGGSKYGNLVTVNNAVTVYTAGFRSDPLPYWMLRGSVSTGVLPPSVDQLTSRVTTLFGYLDAKRGGSFIKFGVPVIVGGSPSLRPERARTLSLGLVYTSPDNRARLSLDFTRLDKKNEVVLTSTNGLRYLTGLANVPFFLANEDRFPGRIQRLPLTAADAALGYTAGLITRIDTTALNIGRTRLDAWDLKAAYEIPDVAEGTLRLTGTAAWQPTYKRRFDTIGRWYDFADAADGALKWRGRAGVEWERGPFWIGLDGQYYGRYRITPAVPATGSDAEGIVRLQGAEYVEAQAYVDLAAAYRFSPNALGRGSLELRLGVQNLFDRSPPIVTTVEEPFYTETGYSLLGDPRQRRFNATLEYRF
ncbi:TonB-dependent receptor [Allosphingosinicella deserti]|uniref:Secretin/TonB short N-terminal domain-containing protein n=1 Tax=Allosphingosinicella deserti TaxID=2116704 RepID=A0A2P7QZF1_9SPHN|nr:TonB-dependent receptor [Sphingomonas deserti]PSJ43331.1 hypothetical protein C7I55_02885 [Sphingomonas deserti]